MPPPCCWCASRCWRRRRTRWTSCSCRHEIISYHDFFVCIYIEREYCLEGFLLKLNIIHTLTHTRITTHTNQYHNFNSGPLYHLPLPLRTHTHTNHTIITRPPPPPPPPPPQFQFRPAVPFASPHSALPSTQQPRTMQCALPASTSTTPAASGSGACVDYSSCVCMHACVCIYYNKSEGGWGGWLSVE
jgi:hypothetical protein